MSETAKPAAPSRARAILFFVVIFLAGSVFGSAATIAVGRRVMQRANDAARWNVDAMHRLDRRLDLSAEQRARVQPILADMAVRLREVRQDSRRSWTSILQDTRDKIRAELTPAQQVEFEKLLRRPRENFGRFLGVSPEAGRNGMGGGDRDGAPPPRPRD